MKRPTFVFALLLVLALLTGMVMLEQSYHGRRSVEEAAAPKLRPSHIAPSAASGTQRHRSGTPAPAMSAEIAALLDPSPRLPARMTLDAALLRSIWIQEIGPALYEVNADITRAVLDNPGRILAVVSPTIRPAFSFANGPGYQISSAAGDGVLTRDGFTVTNPKLAQSAGIEAGDTIVRVNGHPVDGFAGLYAILHEVDRNPTLRAVRVELERQGGSLTKTYRLR